MMTWWQRDEDDDMRVMTWWWSHDGDDMMTMTWWWWRDEDHMMTIRQWRDGDDYEMMMVVMRSGDDRHRGWKFCNNDFVCESDRITHIVSTMRWRLHFTLKWCIVSTWELVFCFSGRSPPDFNFLHRIRSDVFLHFFVIFTFIFHIKVLIGGGVVGLTSSLTLTDTTCITCNYEYKLCDNS